MSVIHAKRVISRKAGCPHLHTLELTKYNLQETTICSAPAIEPWAFFFLFADGYQPERLRELLPGVEFQQAISGVEAIAVKTEDRMMYELFPESETCDG